jgi:hypothetical protein
MLALIFSCAALELRLPPAANPASWRVLFGESVDFPAGSLELRDNSTLLFQVRDTSDLRRTEVVDVVLPGKAVYADKAMVVEYPLVGEARPQLAVVAETEASALAASDPALFDTRVVYSAFYEWNSTWKLFARLRAMHVGSQCEAPFPLPPQEPNVTVGLSSIEQTPGYSGRAVDAALWWDENCSAIPPEVEASFAQRREAASNYSKAHPGTKCLPAGHWHWDSGDPEWAFAEMSVLRTAPQTFYVALGFLGGYVGVQDHGEGSRYLVFSVWDESTMAEVVELGDEVEARRFSGELRGFQLTRKMEWKLETPLRFIVRSESGLEPRYTAYVYDDLYGRWDLIASVRVRPCGKPRSALGPLNSFVEVFGTQDCTSHRQAEYNIWTMSNSETWSPVKKGKLWGTFNESGLRGLIRDADFVLDVGGDLPADPRFGKNLTSPEPKLPAVLRGGVPPVGRGGPAEPAGIVFTDQAASRGSILDSTWRAC